MLWILLTTLVLLAVAAHARLRSRRHLHDLEQRADTAPASFVRGLVSRSASPSRLVIEARRAHRHGAALHVAVARLPESSEDGVDTTLSTIHAIGAAVLPTQLGFHWDTRTVVISSIEPLDGELPCVDLVRWEQQQLTTEDDLAIESVERQWGRAA